MDKLLALRVFMDVAQTGGFSRAAQRRAVATSSVTRLIDGLEASLGVALLTRSTRQVTLTDAGAAYLEQVARLLSDLDEADASVADGGSEAVGPLRVSVPVSFGRLCVGPHIAAFLRAHPRVSLELVLSDAYVDLAAERIDVAVRIGTPEHHPQLIVRPLAGHRRHVVASPGYLACHGTPARPEDLALHECLRFAYQAGPQRWSFLRGGAVQAVEVDGRLAANNADILREAALGGSGIALLAQWLVEEDVRAGRLQRLFADYAINPQDQDVNIHAAWLPNRRHSRKVHAFVDFLQRHMPCAS
ncbi:LysR family transcriptional regulator [Comamonas endophytica]|uniref:LysR family transcriptional regulator n=1 Tax=Comamonas endophytica TaxID=2949090 RepID=A0ABY6G9W6_9BURK|nr:MULTISPECIES: LysR family transcriptional regulator [unclassified Acidovorax]MCD2512035.1 LysR family transcriptional regulator [Acidovorax sp. D4N7]UYG51815.1 LysR family transcriptional regulator [Acidovorax sp. 5MLIR]